MHRFPTYRPDTITRANVERMVEETIATTGAAPDAEEVAAYFFQRPYIRNPKNLVRRRHIRRAAMLMGVTA